MNKYKDDVKVYDYHLFDDSSEHLYAEMEWLELLIKRQLLQALSESKNNSNQSEFSGMYISDDEVTKYLDEKETNEEHTNNLEIIRIEIKAKELRQHIDEKINVTLESGKTLRFVSLCKTFDLSDKERTILLFCLSVDFIPAFQRWFGYLQNDISKKRPTIQLLATIVGIKNNNITEIRRIFQPGATLTKNDLIIWRSKTTDENIPLPWQQPLVPLSVIDYLSDLDGVDVELSNIAKLITPERHDLKTTYFCQHENICNQVENLKNNMNDIPMLSISGPKGSGKIILIENIANDIGKYILRININKLINKQSTSFEIKNKLIRECKLRNCILHIEGVSEKENGKETKTKISEMISSCVEDLNGKNIIFTGNIHYSPGDIGIDKYIIHHSLEYPSIDERFEVWDELLDTDIYEDTVDKLKILAGKFRFTPGQIKRIINNAKDKEGMSTHVRITNEDLLKYCREESNHKLREFGKKLTLKYQWNDIVLPPDTFQQLGEICNSVKHRQRVFSTWGFDKKFSVGKGLYVLFTGSSGTGKTMSAEIIANHLGVDIYKIDLSCVVSKYVGETEKNLSKIFDEAETSNSILFFDEADALFGKRTAVKDAHDRYANIETNFLLQKMDDYEGIVILASNLHKNMDSAFTRRLNYVVEFPQPEKIYRKKIWGKVFPVDTPLDNDIDVDFLSNQFKISGGSIKNIAMSSAFMAATEDSMVRMDHLILSTKREYQKMSKLCSKSEFGQYYSLVRDELT